MGHCHATPPSQTSSTAWRPGTLSRGHPGRGTTPAASPRPGTPTPLSCCSGVTSGMVLGVCRRVLGNVHDADDAFQATFLVLVRKAWSIAARRAVTTWLYAVAYRVALNALKERTRRLGVGPLPDETRNLSPRTNRASRTSAACSTRPSTASRRGTRGPVLLCLPEGRSHAEAGRVLAGAAGTAASRLARAKRDSPPGWRGTASRASGSPLAAGLGASCGGVVRFGPCDHGNASSDQGRAGGRHRAGCCLAASFVPRPGSSRSHVSDATSANAGRRIPDRGRSGGGLFLSARDVPAAEAAGGAPARGPGKAEPPEKKTERTDAFGGPIVGGGRRAARLLLYHDSQVQGVVLHRTASGWLAGTRRATGPGDAQTERSRPSLTYSMSGTRRRRPECRTTMLATADRLRRAVKKEKDRIVLWDVAAGKEIGQLPLRTMPARSSSCSGMARRSSVRRRG